MHARLQLVLGGLSTVFRRPANVATAAVFAFIGLFAAIWITNLPLLKEVLFDPHFTFAARAEILVTSFGAIETNFRLFSRTITLTVIILFGINVAMVVHYLKGRFVLDRAAGTGVLGTVLGMFGVGCASCGSILATSLLGPVLIAAMPLKGLEFGVVGIGVLLFSIYLTSKRIMRPDICEL